MASSSSTPQTLLEAGSSLLHASQSLSSQAVLSLLKESEAPVWYQDPESGWSALHYATEREDLEMIKVLLRYGAVWNAGMRIDLFPVPLSLRIC